MTHHRSLSTHSTGFVATETNKPAGNFDQYTSKCDMKNNGWGLFRPEVYDLKLMEYVDGVPTEVGDDKPWDECED